jgi:methylated-DNA-[protein]-cysteine S-methyltransferase
MTIYTEISSPLGPFFLTSQNGSLTGLYFSDQPHAKIRPDWVRHDEADIFTETARQIEEYASGTRKRFDLPLRCNGTPFQISVWQAIAALPFGQTISYSELAQRVGRSVNDARAIGTATGLNPICWITPCHRVVGKNGALTGYAGGLPRKRALLDFEAGASAVLTPHAAKLVATIQT